VRTWYDIAGRQTLVAHCEDQNPEHWLRIADVVRVRMRRTDSLQRYVRLWVHRIHRWQRMIDD